MKKTISIFAIAAVALGVFSTNARSKEKSSGGFDRLKTLVGEWEATPEGGKTFTSTIRAVSNGTALEETFDNVADGQMVTPLHRGWRTSCVDTLLLDRKPAAHANPGG